MKVLNHTTNECTKLTENKLTITSDWIRILFIGKNKVILNKIMEAYGLRVTTSRLQHN